MVDQIQLLYCHRNRLPEFYEWGILRHVFSAQKRETEPKYTIIFLNPKTFLCYLFRRRLSKFIFLLLSIFTFARH